jgi:hypothetical protein
MGTARTTDHSVEAVSMYRPALMDRTNETWAGTWAPPLHWLLVLAREVREGVPACVLCRLTELFFDAQQLVVLGNTVRTGRGTCLDLASGDRFGQGADLVDLSPIRR